MESFGEPINIIAYITGVCAKLEIGRVAQRGVSNFGEKRRSGKRNREEMRGFEFNQWGHLMSEVRIIDRKENLYKELVIDTDTGTIEKDVEQPLSEHRGHGSAKIKQQV